MPVYKIQAPNGKIYKIEAPEGARDEDLFAYVQQQMTLDSLIPPAPKEQAGFWGAFKDSIATLGLADEAAAFAANPTEENREAFLNAAESKYRYAGGFGTGENWNTFKELLGGSLGALVAPIATGVAGAAAGPAGAIGGFAGTSAAQYSIQNLQRQAEVQQRAAEEGLPVEDIDLGKAAVASAAQAGLDVIPGALILKGLRKFPIAQRLLAEDKVSEQAADILIDAFQKGNISRTGSVVKGVGLGASFEIPQEVAQQALERWQAGLSLTDDEAKEEFKQAAIGAAILGGAFGAVGGYATYRGTRAEGERVIGGVEEDAEIEAQREEELQRMREGEVEEEALREAPPPQEVTVEEEDAEIEAQRQAEFERMRQAEEEEGLRLDEMDQAERRRPDAQITEQPQLDEGLQTSFDRDMARVRSLRLQDLRQQRPDLDSGTIDYLIEQGLTDKQILKFQLPERRGEPLPYEDEEGAEITVPRPAKTAAEPTAPTPVEIPVEVQQAKDLLAAIDKGGMVLNPAKVNAIAANLGLEVSKKAKPLDTVERIRQAVGRFDSQPPAPTPTAPAPQAATPPAPSTEGALEGLGAPVGGGIPAEMFEPPAPAEPTAPTRDPREVALEVIKTTPTIKAISQATGLNQPKAAAIMRGFVDEGIVERVGNKFRLITPEAADVSLTTPDTSEVDVTTGGRGDEVPTLGSAAVQRDLEGAEPTGLDGVSDVTERADVGEGDVSAPLEEVKLDFTPADRSPKNVVLPKLPKGTMVENYSRDAELVPIDWLLSLKPQNRFNEKRVQELVDDISKNGLREPLQIAFGIESRGAVLSEGNHRLEAARRLGYTHMPAVVQKQGAYPKTGYSFKDNRSVDEDLIPKADEYHPQISKPSKTFKSLATPSTKGVLEGEGVPADTGLPSEAFATTRAAPKYKNFRDAIINIAKTKGEATPEDLQAAFDIPIEDATRMFEASLSVPSFRKRYDKAVKERSLKADLRTRALDFIRRTGRGSAVALQNELKIPLGQAKSLRESLLGSGAVVQKANVKAAKTGEKSYFVVEGTYQPEAGYRRETDAVEETTPKPEPLKTEKKISRAEIIRRKADEAEEKAPRKPKTRATPVDPAVLQDEVRRAFADLEMAQAAKGRPAAEQQQTLDLLGGRAKETLSDVEKRILKGIKSAAQYLLNAKKMSIEEMDRFNNELRKAKPNLKKLRRIVDKISARDIDEMDVDTQPDLDENGFIISDNFKQFREAKEDVKEDEYEVDYAPERRRYEPLDFREQILFFRKKALNRFKKTKSSTVGMRAENVSSLIEKITSRWKNPPNFIVVQSYLDLPAMEGVDPESNVTTAGVAIGNDVYIVADNVRSVRDLKATIFHESLGHYGLEQLFGDRLYQTMLDIYRTNARMRADADAWLSENSDTYPTSDFTQEERQALAVEEIFAEMSESGPPSNAQQRSAFNRIAALIRKFARALGKLAGVDLSYTNAEIDSIVSMAHNKVVFGSTQRIPRYNNIRYMKSTYSKVLTDAMRRAQSGAPSATKRILEGNINSLDKLPRSMRKFRLQVLSLHHIMQLYERYAPALRRLNILVERMAKDSTDQMVEHIKKSNAYRKVLREHPNFIDEFNYVAHNLINLPQAPVLEPVLNANMEFVRFKPSAAAKRMLNIQRGTSAYNALKANDKVLHEAVNRFYRLPKAMQDMMVDVYTDYRNYSDQAFKVKLDQFLSKLPPEVVAKIRKKFMDNRLTFYLPLRREGAYRLSYKTREGAPVVTYYPSEAARTVAEEKARRAGGTGFDSTPVGEVKYQEGYVPPGLLGELSKSVEDALKAANVSDGTIKDASRIIFETFMDYIPGAYGNDLRQEANGRTIWEDRNGVKHYGILGFNEDVIGIYESTVPRMINQINNLKYTMPIEKTRAKIVEQFAAYKANKNLDPKYRGVPDIDDNYVKDLTDDMDARIKFAKTPTYSNYVYRIAQANYIYSIALNTSSALINMTIVPMMAWPSLAAKYGVVDASRAIAQATKLFFRNGYRDPKTGRLQFNMSPTFGNGATGELADFHRMLEMRSVTGTSAEQEINQAQNINVPGYEGLSAKVNLAMSYVFRSSERYNREVTSLAAYMLARNVDAEGNTFNSSRQGVSVGRAAEEAIRLNYDVNGATLPETNSRLYQTDIGRIILTFRTHALNMLINLATTFNQAIRVINENEPNADQRRLVRNMAVKKLLYIYGSTYMLAGLKGLPLFGAAEVLASLVMGDDDEPYDLEQKVLDSVGTLGVNGPVNELLNIDIASRTGFYGLLWRDDPKRLAEVGIPVYVMERAIGPTYGLVEAARRGFNDFSEGEIQRGFEAILPAPLRNMLKGSRYFMEGALTRDGLPITEDVSAYNSLMQVLGFAPADLAATQGQRGATYEVSEKLKQRRVSLLTNLYAARTAGNSEAIEKAMADIRKFNGKNPAYQITMDSITRSFKERERRAREAIMGIYQPKNLRAATAQYVTRLDEEDGLIY